MIKTAMPIGKTCCCIMFYGQLALYSGDLAEYSNYCILYNNAAAAFRRISFEQSPVRFDSNVNLW